jgi:hypothetical protein
MNRFNCHSSDKPTVKTLGLVAALLSFAMVSAHAATAQTALSHNLLYTAVTPCRIIDTRVTGGALAANIARSFSVVGSAGYSSQGGNSSSCAIPGILTDAVTFVHHTVQAVLVNFVAVGPTGAGDLLAWPADQEKPTASILNYDNTARGLNIANSIILPVQQTTNSGPDITIEAQVSGTHLVADVYGYFSGGDPSGGALSPSANDNTGIGSAALSALQSGMANTAVGTGSMRELTSGVNNVALGASTLSELGSGDGNIAIGTNAGGNYTGTSPVFTGRRAPAESRSLSTLQVNWERQRRPSGSRTTSGTWETAPRR